MNLQNRIKKIRQTKGYTQDELAKKVKISRPYLSDIERNIYFPGIIIAMNIAKALNVQVEDLFFENDVQHTEQ